MSREKKSRSGGQPGAAATATRDSVRPQQYTPGRGTNATDSVIIWHGGRVIGEVTAAGVFQKRIRGSVHFLRSPRAIAWDVATLHQAEREGGATAVLVIDVETGREYRAPMGTVWAKGFRVSRGHGEQWALRLDVFNRPEEPAQLSLFGGAA